MALISIITVCYNAEKYIEATLKSVAQQSSSNYEYLIIDGNSTDNTLGIIEKYKPYITYLKSEPDNGLYHAMNKGLKEATGTYVWFLNAGDLISYKTFIEDLETECSSFPDIIFGETNFINENQEILGTRSQLTTQQLPEVLNWMAFNYGMLVSHQSFIVKRKLAPSFITTNLSADLDWEIRAIKASNSSHKFSKTIANYLVGGISNKHLKRSLFDRFKVITYHFGFLGAISAHVFIAFRGLKKIISNKGKYW